MLTFIQDQKLAQQLYEEELALQYSGAGGNNKTTHQPPYISPYHKPPPPQPPKESTKAKNTTTSTNYSYKPPNKRQATGNGTEAIKKSSNGIELNRTFFLA